MPIYSEIKFELIEIAGILEKYPESVQPRVFEVLINCYLGDIGKTSTSVPLKPGTLEKPSTEPDSKTSKRKRSLTKESYSVIKELDLRGGNGKPSFKSIFEEKKPRSNIEFNAIAIYYLEKILGLTGITPGHVYTCYLEVGKRTPSSFQQSLWDTSGNRYGYIDASDINNLKIPLRGINLVEHDLPRQSTKKA